MNIEDIKALPVADIAEKGLCLISLGDIPLPFGRL